MFSFDIDRFRPFSNSHNYLVYAKLTTMVRSWVIARIFLRSVSYHHQTEMASTLKGILRVRSENCKRR